MQWSPGDVSSDIEDRRGSSGGGGFGFGGFHIGIGGAIILLILSVVFHRNFFALLGGNAAAPARAVQQRPAQESPEEHRDVQFVSFVLDDAQSTWSQILPQYHHAKLVLFRDAIDSACGFAQSASGPFYCPGDERVYIDLGFYEELRQRFGAPGEFAQAYVIAHGAVPSPHRPNVSQSSLRRLRGMTRQPGGCRFDDALVPALNSSSLSSRSARIGPSPISPAYAAFASSRVRCE